MQNAIIPLFSIQSPLPLFSFLFGVLFCLKIFLTINMASKEAWHIFILYIYNLKIYIANSTATVTTNSLKCLHRGTQPCRNPSAPSNVSSCRWRWGPVGPTRTGCGHLHCPARSLPPGGQTQSEADLWKWSIPIILKPHFFWKCAPREWTCQQERECSSHRFEQGAAMSACLKGSPECFSLTCRYNQPGPLGE